MARTPNIINLDLNPEAEALSVLKILYYYIMIIIVCVQYDYNRASIAQMLGIIKVK